MPGPGTPGTVVGLVPSRRLQSMGETDTLPVHFMLLWFVLCSLGEAFLEEETPERSLKAESS